MKARHLLPAAALLVSGLLIYRFVYGMGFAGMLLGLCALVVLLFGAVHALRRRFPRAMKWVQRMMLGALALTLLLAAATGAWILSFCKGDEQTQADWLIVLGAGVDGETPSVSLTQRLRAAQDYLERYPEAKAVLSGGKGSNEHISEAECMYRYLTERGIDPSRLRKEERSTSTEENFRFSLELIVEEDSAAPAQAAVVSSEFHLCRASIFARRVGLEALCVPAHTGNRVFFMNMFVREIFGVWVALLFG